MTRELLSASGHVDWDDLEAWWLSRLKASTQQTYARVTTAVRKCHGPKPQHTADQVLRGLLRAQSGFTDTGASARKLCRSPGRE